MVGSALTLQVAAFAPLALAATNVGLWEWDPREDLIRGDAKLAEMFGLDANEIAQGLPLRRFADIVDQRDRSVFERRVEQVQRTGGLIVIEYRTHPQLEDMRWVLVRGRYELDENGVLVSGRGIAIDITESKRDEPGEDTAFFLHASPDEPDSDLDEDADHPVARLCDAAIAIHQALQDMRAHHDPHEPLEACNRMTLELIAQFLAQHTTPVGRV